MLLVMSNHLIYWMSFSDSLFSELHLNGPIVVTS